MTNRKTNLLIFHHDASLYGASLSLLTMLEHKAFQDEYKALVLLPYPGDMEDKLKSINIDYKIITFPRCIAAESHSYWIRLRNILKYVKKEQVIIPQLKIVAEEFQPELIYTNTSIISIGYKLSQLLKVPHIWHIREFSDFYRFQYLPLNFIVRKYISRSELSLYSSVALKSHWKQGNNPNSKVVFNGIVSGNYILSKREKQNGAWKFGMIGLIVEGKRHDVAIKAFSHLIKKYPNCELHFWGGVGDFIFKRALNEILNQNNYKSVVFFHDYEECNEIIFSQLDIVLSCATNEAFGRTIVEAMSRGIPVIANASGGPLEIIDDGINGLFFHQTPESLFEKMEQLITNKELYVTISKNSIEKAFSSYTVERYQEEILNSFNSVLKMDN